jgi:hypothetical protein
VPMIEHKEIKNIDDFKTKLLTNKYRFSKDGQKDNFQIVFHEDKNKNKTYGIALNTDETSFITPTNAYKK